MVNKLFILFENPKKAFEIVERSDHVTNEQIEILRPSKWAIRQEVQGPGLS